MNLIEAIKSGKRFRRPNARSGYQEWTAPTADAFGIGREDLIADDWEVEEKKVEITHGQLMQAIERILSRPFEVISMATKLTKELGLE